MSNQRQPVWAGVISLLNISANYQFPHAEFGARCLYFSQKSQRVSAGFVNKYVVTIVGYHSPDVISSGFHSESAEHIHQTIAQLYGSCR